MTTKQLDFIREISLKFPFFSQEVSLFIACQFALESNYGSSRLATECNNYCGMKSPRVRFSTEIYPYLSSDVHGDYFAEYDSIDDCVTDYVIWLAFSRFTQRDMSDVQLFCNKLKRSGYCPEPDYITRIFVIYRQFLDNVNVK